MSIRKRPPAGSGDRHPVDEPMPFGPLLLYGLQHVMSMYAGLVAVPLIVAEAPPPGVTPSHDVVGGPRERSGGPASGTDRAAPGP